GPFPCGDALRDPFPQGAGSSLEAHAAPPAGAGRPFADQLDASGIERIDDFHERIDVAADGPRARLHPLDGREGQARRLGKRTLVDAQKGARGAKLCGSYHVSDISYLFSEVNTNI